MHRKGRFSFSNQKMGLSVVVHEVFEMPGVPVEIAEETFFRDLESTPRFIPRLIELRVRRGKPLEVGTSWDERRAFHDDEIVIRKTITDMSENPFTLRASMEIVKGHWRIPRFESSFTSVIAESPSSTDEEPCTIHDWTHAYVPAGCIATVLSFFWKGLQF